VAAGARRSRILWCGLLGAATALAVVAALVADLFLFPHVARVSGSADAVVLLAGSSPDRLPVAVRLAREGSGVLVVSAAGGRTNAPSRALCHDPGDLVVLCFRPSPSTTRGEGRAIGRLVEEQNWTRITVVTSTYHLTRAALTIGRCTDAEVQMAEAEPGLSVGEWVTRVGHETGGLLETALAPGC
jgi:uncharacterized SAM-binding protein YcdF (DUF218 family)